MSELKPCPFCGGLNQTIEECFNYTFSEAFVQCDSCGARSEIEDNVSPKKAKEKAIKIWNTRPIEDALRAENERLKKALKEAEDRIFEWNDLSDEG